MVDDFDLKNPTTRFRFVFRLYNFVSLARDDNLTLRDSDGRVDQLSLDVKYLGLPTLTHLGKRKRDPDGANNPSPKKPKVAGEPGESDVLSEHNENEILSDVALRNELERAGCIVTPEVEGFRTLLPVRVFFP